MALSESLKEELRKYFLENDPTKVSELDGAIYGIRHDILNERKNKKYPTGQFIIGRSVRYPEIPRPANFTGRYWQNIDYNNPITVITDLIYVKEDRNYKNRLLFDVNLQEYQNGFFICSETGDLSNHSIHYGTVKEPRYGGNRRGGRHYLAYNNLKSFIASATKLKVNKEIIDKYVNMYVTQFGPKTIRIV